MVHDQWSLITGQYGKLSPSWRQLKVYRALQSRPAVSNSIFKYREKGHKISVIFEYLNFESVICREKIATRVIIATSYITGSVRSSIISSKKELTRNLDKFQKRVAVNLFITWEKVRECIMKSLMKTNNFWRRNIKEWFILGHSKFENAP